MPTLGMILKGYPRISETFISNEIELLEKEGVEIHILSMRHPREDFTHDSVQRIRARVTYLPTELWPNILRLTDGLLLAIARKPLTGLRTLAGGLWRLARTRKTATLKHMLQGAFVAGRVLPHVDISHLHAHFAHSPTSVATFAARFAGLPFSFTAHAKDIWTQDPDKLAAKLREAQFTVTCTKHNAEYLRSLDSGADVSCVYHGIDLQLFASPDPKTQTKEPYTILTVARLTTKKGLPTVLRAVAQLVRGGMAVRHHIVGDGELREATEALVAELDLGEVVTLHGTKTHADVVELFHKADLFAIGCEVAENGDRDGIPNVLVESLATGVPVVATDVSALPELIVDGESGLVVPPREPQAMAEAMRRLLTDEDLRKRVIENGAQRVQTQFDNRVNTAELARIFVAHGVHRSHP